MKARWQLRRHSASYRVRKSTTWGTEILQVNCGKEAVSGYMYLAIPTPSITTIYHHIATHFYLSLPQLSLIHANNQSEWLSSSIMTLERTRMIAKHGNVYIKY